MWVSWRSHIQNRIAMSLFDSKIKKSASQKKSDEYIDVLNQVQVYLSDEQFDQALGILDQLYRINSTDLHLNLLIAEVHLTIGQYREARRYFTNASRIDRNNGQARYGLGKASYLFGDIENAIVHLQATLDFENYQADVFNDLGSIYDEMKQGEEAEKYYRMAIGKKQAFPLPVINLSSLLVRNQRHAEALNVIESYLASNRPDERIYINQGVILEDLDRYEDAIEAFTKAINCNNANVEAYFDRAFCYLKLARIDQARADLQAYLEKVPDSEQARGLLGLTYTLEGKFQDSMDTWKEFLPIFDTLKTKSTHPGTRVKINPVQILDSLDLQNKSDSNKPVMYSIVIPVLDEAGSLIILYENLKPVMESLGEKYEIIFIDDGSQDDSLAIITDIASQDNSISVIKFRKNYGQTAAFAAGFKYARGEVVITMDADLQNDPKDIPRLLEKMAEGYDLVSGWRKDRQDKTFSRKIPSIFANRIINKLISGTKIKIHDFGCSLKAYKKGVVKNIRIYGEMHRFIPAYAAWLGIKVAEIPVNHHPRQYGYAKYGLDRVGRVVLDLITLRFFTGFRSRPLQFFGKIAIFVTFIGASFSLLLLTAGLISPFGINFQTFIILIMLAIMSGFQFIVVGLLSEIIMRGFLESQNRDEYVVENIYSGATIGRS